MINLKSVMSNPVITVTPEAKLSEVVTLMGYHNISVVVVVDGKFPVSIFTERSLLRLVTAGDYNPHQAIKEIILTKPITSPTGTDIHEAYLLFLQHNIRHMIVVDDQGMLAGIATETDLLHSLGLEYFVSFDNLKEVTTQNVTSLKPDESVATALQLMNNSKISSIVIEENWKPIGIITERDIVRLVQNGVEIHSTSLREAMSHPVRTVTTDISAHTAAGLFRKNNIRRLVIVDKNEQLAGIVTETDIVKGLQSDYVNLLKDVIETQVIELRTVRKQLNDKIILESMMESSTDIAFVITDLDYNVLHSNKTAKTLFGYNRQEANKIGLTTILHREGISKKHLNHAVDNIKKKGKFSFTYTNKKAQYFHHIESNVFGIKNKNNGIEGYVLIGKDITDSIGTNRRLKKRSKELEETNAALRVLLRQREFDKAEMSQIFQQNVDQLILPFFCKLRKSNNDPNQNNIIKSIESNLRQINSPFAHRISSLYSKLTPAEIQVANLIKNGHSSKETASILNLSDKTVYTHRRNIRKKSGITNQKVNLQTILQQAEET